MLDEGLRLLADHPRRALLVEFLEGGPQAEVSVPEGIDTSRYDPEELWSQLYHVHLPKLADSGVIRWNEQQGTVVRGPRFDGIQPLVSALDANADQLHGEWP
jgi:hypothetical protein